MSNADEILREANWARMRTAITDAANEYRRLADQLERVSFENSRGRRSPDAIISEVSLTAHTNTAATLVHRLASWAESINEIDRHGAGAVCGYRDDSTDRTCVLMPGHDLPIVAGRTEHVAPNGSVFL